MKPHTPPPIPLQLQTPLITIEFHITNKTSMKTQQNNYDIYYQHIILKLKTKILPSSIIATNILMRRQPGTSNEKNANFQNENICQMQSQFGSMYNLPQQN